jgi:hypothetical protein
MEGKRDQFARHTATISAILQSECKISEAGPLVIDHEFQIAIPNRAMPPFRQVTNDSGIVSCVLELPISTKRHQRKYWVGLHESWALVSRHKIRFSQCSLRLYVGGPNQDPTQFLRLEWVAPDADSGKYPGEHAGHPHWHIGRTVLAESTALMSTLEGSVPDQDPAVEEFGALTGPREPPQGEDFVDWSWVQNIHLPAQAGWIKKWNGTDIPGPHQSEPDNFEALENWWAGALRYFVHEFTSLRE